MMGRVQGLRLDQEGRESHPEIALGLARLGSCYGDMGEFDKADKIFERCLEMNQEIFGKDDHVNVAECYECRAEVEMRRGRVKEAAEWFDKSLVIWRKVLGSEEKHPNVMRLEEKINICMNQSSVFSHVMNMIY